MRIDTESLGVVFLPAVAAVDAFFSEADRPVLARLLRRAQRRHRFATDSQRKTFATLCFGTVAHAYRLDWRLRGDDEADGGVRPRASAHALVSAYLRAVHQIERDTLTALGAADVELRPLGDAPPAVVAGLPPVLFNGLDTSGIDTNAAAASLLTPGPVTLRVNVRQYTRDALSAAIAAEQDVDTAPGLLNRDALHVTRGPLNVRGSALWQRGAFEVQDEGSQCIASLVEAVDGEQILDYCAGRGGKTLALAARHDPAAVTIFDVDQVALDAALGRLRKAGIHGVKVAGRQAQSKYDWVLVDAPCSASGTLRRGADLMWRMQKSPSAWAAEQSEILSAAAAKVAPGGHLVYATCSFLVEENEGVRDTFLQAHPEFVPEVDAGGVLDAAGTRRLWPHRDGTDAFYMARFGRLSSSTARGGEV